MTIAQIEQSVIDLARNAAAIMAPLDAIAPNRFWWGCDFSDRRPDGDGAFIYIHDKQLPHSVTTQSTYGLDWSAALEAARDKMLRRIREAQAA